jgi:hypothetical protein
MGANARSGDRLGAAVGIEGPSFSEFPDAFLLGISGGDVATAVDAGVVLKFSQFGGVGSVYTQSDGAVSVRIRRRAQLIRHESKGRVIERCAACDIVHHYGLVIDLIANLRRLAVTLTNPVVAVAS